MTTLPGYFPFGSLSPEAITIVPGEQRAVSGELEVPPQPVRAARQPVATVVASEPRRAVPLEHLRRLVEEAHDKYQRATKDFRRVEGVAAPNAYGITFSAMRVMFYKWVELAAVSLERAGVALDEAMVHVLDHLYQRTAAGKVGGAAQCREILDQLDNMRGRVQEQQQFLSTLMARSCQ